MSQIDQSNATKQPTYNYSDQSLSPTPETQPTIRARRLRFRLLRTLIQVGFVLLPFVCAWILTSHYATTYNSYQQGSCTIYSKGVSEVDNKDKGGHITSRAYLPRFDYDVQTVNGAQAVASGYDGPTARGYPSATQAQTVADQYQIGQVVQCWYNPAAPAKAFIVFYGFTSVDSAEVWSAGFWVIVPLALMIYLLFNWTVWRPFALRKRGVVTQGNVTNVKQRQGNRGAVYYTSIITFQAREEPRRTRSVSVDSDLGIGTMQPVCYDPLFPRYRRRGEWPSRVIGPGVVVIIVLTIIGLTILGVIWFIP